MRKIVAGVLVAVAVALAIASPAVTGATTAPPTIVAGQLTVGVSLPSEGFEVGVVNGATVIYAQGFDIALARALAAKLGLARVSFVQSNFGALLTPGAKPWDLAIAQITITPARSRILSFSQPYLSAEQGVLAARSLQPVPTSLAGLRPLQICALRGSTGADVATTRIAPRRPVLLVADVATLMLDLQTGHCQAVVYDAATLGTLKARAPAWYGPFIGVIPTNEQYGIALPKASPLLGAVNAALASLTSDGTIQRLQKKWLASNLSSLSVLH